MQKARCVVGIKIDFTCAYHEPCARCGGQDDAGGLELVDDQKVRKVLCRKCTLKLVTVCLEPSGNGKALS
jgi:hypothetical protein